ncbi:unnamed protein product [Penicillium roqueforti FM164]|uniref:Genomic scaffold, ProqFM164S03 n=1 Tax=Penicillium roqueforti (strain FM164) TaxID=1365484 RepID=W6QV09_PENRF|nr:unnamed protein product [Penicillium roqueforti FM164]
MDKQASTFELPHSSFHFELPLRASTSSFHFEPTNSSFHFELPHYSTIHLTTHNALPFKRRNR